MFEAAAGQLQAGGWAAGGFQLCGRSSSIREHCALCKSAELRTLLREIRSLLAPQ